MLEIAIGTGIDLSDTDNDGILDGVEVQNGSDPLDGILVATGLIATADTPGIARDVDSVDERIVLADGEAGVTVFNAFNGMEPLILAQVDTAGTATAVALSGDRVAVADGTAGLSIVDITNPVQAAVEKVIPAALLGGGEIQAVAASGGLAFVGSSEGTVSAVTLEGGFVYNSVVLPAPVLDVALADSYLYVYTPEKLHILSTLDGSLATVGSVDSPEASGFNTAVGRGRVFAGDGLAYTVHTRGYNVIDVSNPAAPVLVTETTTPQFGWKDVAVDGAGRGVAAMSPNQGFDGPHDVSLYDFSDPAITGDAAFLTTFETPGVAHAVNLYNGLAYVADYEDGLQVLNYQSSDIQENPPTGSLSTSASGGTAEAATLLLVSAAVSDDVQLRNVLFYADGALISTDGNFPYEILYPVPNTPGEDISFTAVATDTGGNRTNLGPIAVSVVPDTTPPTVQLQSITNDLGRSPILTGDGILVTLTIGGIDSLNGEIQFFVNGQPVTPQRLRGNQWLFPTPSTPGDVQISVTATDGAGNETTLDLGTVHVYGEAISRMVSVYNDTTGLPGPKDVISRQVSVYRGNVETRLTPEGVLIDLRLFRNLNPNTITFFINGVEVTGVEIEPGLWRLTGTSLPSTWSVSMDFGDGNVATIDSGDLEPAAKGAVSRQVSVYKSSIETRLTAEGFIIDLRLFRNLNPDTITFTINGLPVTGTQIEPGLWRFTANTPPDSWTVSMDFGDGDIATINSDDAPSEASGATSRQVSAYNFDMTPRVSGTDMVFDLRPFARFGIASVKAFVDEVEVTPLEASPGVWGIPRPGYAPFSLRIETTLQNGAVAISKFTDSDFQGEAISRQVSVENTVE